MPFLKSSLEGCLFVDHRASPGIPPDLAMAMGYDPKLVGEGKVAEIPTLTCKHCKTPIVKNPWRTRDRGHCHVCDHYLCDWCMAETKLEGYVHRPFEQIADMVLSGKYELADGSTAPHPVLIPSGEKNG